jgi:hypothetical protein
MMKLRFEYIIEIVCRMLQKLQQGFCLFRQKRPTIIHNALVMGERMENLLSISCSAISVIKPLTGDEQRYLLKLPYL